MSLIMSLFKNLLHLEQKKKKKELIKPHLCGCHLEL